jgi:hypothetical protein
MIDLSLMMKMKDGINMKEMDTMTKVSQMMGTIMNQNPEPANEYLRYLSSKYGFCGEMIITAYAHYCQAVLKLPCDNSDYLINEEGINWFVNH